MDILSLIDIGELLGRAVNLLWVGLGLGLVIFFHELGHFAVAKWCNVHVERFSIGFGPILWSRQRGETEYALSAIPFGGYVKMLGQDDMDPSQMSNTEITSNPRSYPAKSVGQRMAIISAGVVMNIITGLMFFALAFKLGVRVPSADVGATIVGSPAWNAGIDGGDRITHINGTPTNSFMDITVGVTLSSGDIEVKGLKRNGEEFSAMISPDTSGTRRTIGVVPERGLRLLSLAEGNDKVSPPGTSAWQADLRPDDTIVGVDETSIDDFAVLAETFARKRAESITLKVQRFDEDAEDDIGPTEEVELPPGKFHSLGLWMDLGTISHVRRDSIAQRAGFLVGDKITTVNGQQVGTEFDPLRLPDMFGDLAGQAVEVVVRRQEQGSGDKTVTLEVTPQDIPGWVDRPMVGNVTEPLPIASLGIALPIIPRVVKVLEDSPAAKAGIEPNDTVTGIKYSLPDGIEDFFDGNRDFELDLSGKTSEGTTSKPINWASAFWGMQVMRARDVTLTIKSGDQTREHKFAAADRMEVEDWYLPVRGLAMYSASVIQKGDGFVEAAKMGIAHTRNSAAQIYLTLRSLFRGDLSPKELHGPIGIFKVGYLVAREGLSKLLLFLGFLSVNLAVLNFLPIPVLDGGHMVFLIWEGVTRRKPSERLVNGATMLGMAFVFGLMLYVVWLDIFVHWLGGS